jgi:hypothetical protein
MVYPLTEREASYATLAALAQGNAITIQESL